MKVSELTVADIADYLRIMPGDLDETEKRLWRDFWKLQKAMLCPIRG